MTHRSVMIRGLVLLAALLLAVVASGRMQLHDAGGAAKTEIQVVLDQQLAAWNRGDIEGFMAGYWQSPELVYLTDSKIVRGWQTLLDYYRQAFRAPNEAKMGILSLPEEEITLLGRDSALVWGTYVVKTKDGDARGGRYTLAMRKLPQGWRTVYDRTSVKPMSPADAAQVH